MPDDLSSLHRAALENMCQNFRNDRAEPVNQDSNSATTPLSPPKGKYLSFSKPTNQSINKPFNILKSGPQNGRFLGERRQAQDGRGARNTRQVEGSEEGDSRLPLSRVSRAPRLPRASLRAYVSYFLCIRK